MDIADSDTKLFQNSQFVLAGAADRARVAAMLARAFAQDPVFGWILPDAATRVARLTRLFALMFDADGAVGMRLMAPDVQSATLWRRPGQAADGLTSMLRHALPILGALGGGTLRGLRAATAIEAHFPREPFWYLHVVGSDPAHRGEGWGRAALQAGLARIGSAFPVYLETGTEANLRFYEALGFRNTGEWRIPKAGPRLWSMLRP